MESEYQMSVYSINRIKLTSLSNVPLVMQSSYGKDRGKIRGMLGAGAIWF